MLIHTTKGDLDESLLWKKEGEVNNDNEHTISVEYCLAHCEGPAHKTGESDSQSFFCSQHVHRSVHVTLKKNPSAISGIGGIGG